MNEQELCKKRLMDLSNQANQKEIVTFSDFLNLNEQNIFHSLKFYTSTKLFGGYETAERQMVAFIPDALYYEWDYPICCLVISPKYPKYAEKLSHRDVLGAIMHLGIERSKLGDIVFMDDSFYIFCDEFIATVIMEQLSKIKHTIVTVSKLTEYLDLNISPKYETRTDMIASNRIDCIVAKAYHYSRSQAAALFLQEKVFVDGRTVTNCNESVKDGAIVSVRGKGRFIFRTNNSMSKKGKLMVQFMMYQ